MMLEMNIRIILKKIVTSFTGTLVAVYVLKENNKVRA